MKYYFYFVGAVFLLGTAGCATGQPKVAPLIKQLRSSNPEKKIRAANTLAGLGVAARPALPGLLTVLRDTRRPVFEASAKAVLATGDEGVTALATTLGDKDAWVRCRAAESLGWAGPAAAPAVAALADALRDHDFCVQEKAADSLGQIGEAALPALLEVFKDPNPSVRQLAARSLSRMAPAQQRQAAEAILPMVRDGNEFERGEAMQRLTTLGPAALTAMLDLLWDKDADLRHKAVDGFEEIGEVTPGVIDALAGLFRDSENTLRLRAAVVLGKMGETHPVVLQRLSPLLNAPVENTRRGAIQAIGNMRAAAASAVPTLVAIMNDPADKLSSEAVEALNNIGTREALRAAENFTQKDYLKRHGSKPQ